MFGGVGSSQEAEARLAAASRVRRVCASAVPLVMVALAPSSASALALSPANPPYPPSSAILRVADAKPDDLDQEPVCKAWKQQFRQNLKDRITEKLKAQYSGRELRLKVNERLEKRLIALQPRIQEKCKKLRLAARIRERRRAKALYGGRSQSMVQVMNEGAVGQVSSMLEKQLEMSYAAQINGVLTSVQHYTLRDGLSMFASSSVSTSEHDGFSIGTGGSTVDGLPFSTQSYGLTAGVRWDASRLLVIPENLLTFGVFGNYTHTDVTIEADDLVKDLGSDELGEGDIESFGAGAYSLLNLSSLYVITVGSFAWGSPNFLSGVSGAESAFDTTGFLASVMVGTVRDLGDAVKIDVRGGLSYARSKADDYQDSLDLAFTDSKIEDVTGQASVKLFTTRQTETLTLRPFVQAGAAHRFKNTNEVSVEGERYTFDDDDTSYFGRIGLDFDYSDKVQSFVAVQGDVSSDREAISGQLGITFKLD